MRFERPDAFPTKRPAFMMPETAREERVPTEVMFGCEEAVTERAVGTVETFEPFMEDRAWPVPEMRPETAREERVPTEVMFGCEAAVTLWAVPTVPTIDDAGMSKRPEPTPEKVPPVTVPTTVRLVRDPTEVMLVWAGSTTDPAV